MKSAQQIKQQIVTALEGCGVFDKVLTPSDDRKDSTIMREPSAAVYFTGLKQSDDNGVQVPVAEFAVYMKFLKIGVNDTTEDIELAINALSGLEPLSVSYKSVNGENTRSAFYQTNISFAGCRQ